MYDVWHTIRIVISRAFSLKIEYNFHKFEILFDSKFSLDLYESSDAVQQTYKLIDCSNSNHIHHISLVSTPILLIQIFSTYIYVEPKVWLLTGSVQKENDFSTWWRGKLWSGFFFPQLGESPFWYLKTTQKGPFYVWFCPLLGVLFSNLFENFLKFSVVSALHNFSNLK